MHPATAIALSVSLLAAAGCLGSSAPAGTEHANTSAAPAATPGAVALTATASPQAATAAWTVANWTGFLRVGAAYEATSHMKETNAATAGVWSPSFHYEVVQVPQALEI